MAKGYTRWRGRSIQVLVYAGKGRYVRETVPWQGTKKETERSAERVKRRLLDELDVGSHRGPDATVAQLIARWRRHAEADWSPTTRAAYGSYLRNHVLPAIGHLKVVDVRPDTLDDLYADLRAKGLSAASVGKVHVILRRAFGEAERWRWITVNPAAAARPPQVRRPDLSPPSVEQVRQLLDEAGPDMRAYLTVAADTGARRGEVCALRWSDVDLEHAEVTIARAVVLDGPKVVEKDTKTHQARRIALGSAAVAALREHRRRAAERALAAGASLAPDAFVFSFDEASRTPWRPDGVTQRLARLRARCGCELEPGERCTRPEHEWRRRLRLHDLRHAMVTDWLAAGVDPRTVMGRVGHASLQTLTRYSHFVPAADREAADRLDRLGRDAR